MDIKKRSRKQEEKVAKELNGRPTPASGALWGAKGDVKSEQFLVECKFTDSDYYALSKKVWRKIEKEALSDNFRTPLMCIEVLGESCAVIRREDFEMYYGKAVDTEAFEYISSVTKSSFRIKNVDGIYLQSCVGWAIDKSTLELLVMPWYMFKQLLDI